MAQYKVGEIYCTKNIGIIEKYSHYTRLYTHKNTSNINKEIDYAIQTNAIICMNCLTISMVSIAFVAGLALMVSDSIKKY